MMRYATPIIRHWTWITLVMVLALAPAGVLTAQSQPAEPPEGEALTAEALAAYFDATLVPQMAEDHVVGATVAVVADGELRFARGYGLANLAENRPVEVDRTLFFPGSVGKLFTWTAVMQLVEQGKLDLHTDVNDYLDFTLPVTFDAPITLEHLMTHTAGFEDQLAALQVDGAEDLLPLRDFLIEFMPARVYPPGEYFAYSNYGTALAGYIVERVAQEPYAEYVATHLLEPLGMTRSAAMQPLPESLAVDYSQGYHYRDGGYAARDFEWIAALPEAPVRATATDMARFMLAHLNGGALDDARILDESSVAAMHELHFAHDPWLMGMGYGFMVSQENGRSVSWHTGGSAHFSTLLALLPDEDAGLYISYNTPVTELRALLTDFMNHFYPAAPVVNAEAHPPAGTRSRLAALEGTYAPAIMAHTTPQKFISLFQQLPVQAEDETLTVGPHRYVEVEPRHFVQVDGPRKLSYATAGENDPAGNVEAIFWGPYAYLRLPWFQTQAVQGALAGIMLLLFASSLLAWPVAVLAQRRRGMQRQTGWSRLAWISVVLLSLINLLLFAWFMVSMAAYAETYIFPVTSVAWITRLWWLSVPLTVVVAAFALLTRRRLGWGAGWSVYYAVVAGGGVVFLGFLWNWNLLA